MTSPPGNFRFTAAQDTAFRQEIAHWAAYFHEPSRNGGLKPDLITDPIELRQFTAFVTWAAWASVAARPGEVLLLHQQFSLRPERRQCAHRGRAAMERSQPDGLARGNSDRAAGLRQIRLPGLDHPGPQRQAARCCLGDSSPGQNALVKFFVVVALLLLAQSLVGSATAHYRADPGSFYGFQLERIFPSNLMRTWHLQTGDLLDRYCLRGRRAVPGLFAANAMNRAGWRVGRMCCSLRLRWSSSAACWANGRDLEQLLGRWWFWLGNQGWEYLELGRVWQYLLVAGLFAWFALLWSLVRAAVR